MLMDPKIALNHSVVYDVGWDVDNLSFRMSRQEARQARKTAAAIRKVLLARTLGKRVAEKLFLVKFFTEFS